MDRCASLGPDDLCHQWSILLATAVPAQRGVCLSMQTLASPAWLSRSGMRGLEKGAHL